MRRFLFYEDLKPQKGIPFHRAHVHKLVKLGKFPKPSKFGDLRNVWLEGDIDAWIEAQFAERAVAGTPEPGPTPEAAGSICDHDDGGLQPVASSGQRLRLARVSDHVDAEEEH